MTGYVRKTHYTDAQLLQDAPLPPYEWLFWLLLTAALVGLAIFECVRGDSPADPAESRTLNHIVEAAR